MPKSKKPRKPRRQYTKREGEDMSIKLAGFLLRVSPEWTDAMRDGETLQTMEDIHALLASTTKDSTVKRDMWRRVMTQLLVGAELVRHTNQSEALLREIEGGNRTFQYAFNYWMQKGKLLKPNLEATRDVLRTILEVKFAYRPYELWLCYKALYRDEGYLLKLERQLNTKVSKNIIECF